MTRTKVYLIINALLCAALTVHLAFTAVDIYREGAALRAGGDALTWMYTPELIWQRFLPIAPLLFIAIGMAAAGLILGARDESAEKTVQSKASARDMVCSRVVTPSPAMQSERRKQTALCFGGALAFVLCMTPVAVYMCDIGHFPADGGSLEWMFVSLMWWLIPCGIGGTACVALSNRLIERSVEREIDAAKAQLALERGDSQSRIDAVSGGNLMHKNRAIVAVRIAVFVAAIVMIIAGVVNGGMRDVLIKAINLCTECVGLG